MLCYFLLLVAGTSAPCSHCEEFAGLMKIAGFLLLTAGWLLVLAAIVLLGSAGARSAFVLAGLGTEALGLTLAVRSHLSRGSGRDRIGPRSDRA
jgi:hypothetical protein